MSPGIIDGLPDNAPRRASIVLLFLTPVAYVLFLLINSLDLLIERATRRLPWLSTLTVTLAFSLLLFAMVYRPELDDVSFTARDALVSLLGAGILILPMSIWRRRIETKKNAEPDPSAYPATRVR